MLSDVRIGIIGCGAVTEFSYLPSLKDIEGMKLVCMVDKDRRRALRLGKEYNIPNAEEDYRKIVDKVDAVIIALPNNLHCEVALFFLKNKINVLVEKPMATSTKECDEMIQEAERNSVKLAVGHVRRFFYNSRMIKQIINDRWIGDVQEFSLKEGGIFNWPTESHFYFDRSQAGGGVLMNTGPHILDLLLWWFGEPEKIEYQDDNFGGLEGNCFIKMKMRNGAEGTVKMTQLVPIDTNFIVKGTKGFVITRPFDFGKVRIFLEGIGLCELHAPKKIGILDYFKLEVSNFILSIRDDTRPLVDGLEGKKSIQLIEECYRKRHPMGTPWLVKYD